LRASRGVQGEARRRFVAHGVPSRQLTCSGRSSKLLGPQHSLVNFAHASFLGCFHVSISPAPHCRTYSAAHNVCRENSALVDFLADLPKLTQLTIIFELTRSHAGASDLQPNKCNIRRQKPRQYSTTSNLQRVGNAIEVAKWSRASGASGPTAYIAAAIKKFARFGRKSHKVKHAKHKTWKP
jgi:hypothetical protein